MIDHAYDWRARRLARPAVGRGGHSRAACRHVHAGRARFRAAIDKLDTWPTPGFTAIELMPLADFPGRRNWGYDGVLLYAPDSAYGRPDDLQGADRRRACARPDGVSRRRLQPLRAGGKLSRPLRAAFFTDGRTRRGAAPSTIACRRCAPSRSRMRCTGSTTIASTVCGSTPCTPSSSRASRRSCDELSQARRRARRASRPARSIWCWRTTTTSAGLLDPRHRPPHGQIPRAVERRLSPRLARAADRREHRLLRGLCRRSASTHARAACWRRALPIRASPRRIATARRAASRAGHLPPTAFVNFLQNHDQIGNRALRRAPATLAPAGASRPRLAVMLLAPMPPLMFMGEEWGATRRFPFFCDFHGELADAVREGRRSEFARRLCGVSDERMPDPLRETTFRSAMLDWSERDEPRHRGAARIWCAICWLPRRRRSCRASPICSRARRSCGIASGACFSADWRLGDGSAAAARPTLERCMQRRPHGIAAGRADLGRRAARAARARGRCSGASETLMPPDDPARDLPAAAHGALRLRRRGSASCPI